MEPDERAAAHAAVVSAQPPTRRGRATRAQLLTAARQVFTDKHYADAKITDITSTAGVATGSFYSYFASKEQVFREVAFEVIDELVAAARPDPDNPDRHPARDIVYTIRQYVEVALRYRKLTGSIQQLSHLDPELRAYRTRRVAQQVARSQRAIQRLQQQGLADPRVDAAVLAQVLQSMVISSVYDILVDPQTNPGTERLITELTHVWVSSIGLETS
jgi:AcrR family transcriptional regulator